ncbi:pyridoxamine 5'-phosphate oxidase family protein [Nocardia sp. 348MFTsu5.1]|jgi:hypothetical protein|uniref:pyridoxamine 5'-phosphate oxidase family protein n=1 Tax=Nocardia sp. 348MFTsu5.1 TaxID=1172185 RepID=UPI00037A78D5|nr:pyridoxamine 5'-phosphate oxidase family protein [Nocardia sp. 348MFTsu5.1]
MTEKLDNLEDLSAFKLTADEREKLFELQDECTVSWTNKDGWPVSMPHSFVRSEGKFWVHTASNRKRVQALRARPQSCITVSSLGTEMIGAMITTKTLATVHDGDRDLVRWLLPLFLKRVGMAADDEAFDQQMALLDTPARVVIEFDPVDFFTYNSEALSRAVASSGYDRWDRT